VAEQVLEHVMEALVGAGIRPAQRRTA